VAAGRRPSPELDPPHFRRPLHRHRRRAGAGREQRRLLHQLPRPGPGRPDTQPLRLALAPLLLRRQLRGVGADQADLGPARGVPPPPVHRPTGVNVPVSGPQTSANTRHGPPDPPTCFGAPTITVAPDGGTAASPASISTP